MPRFAYVPGVVEQPEGTKTLYGDRNGDTTSYIPDEVYCNRDGRDLHFQLLVPRMTDRLNFHLMERNGPVGFRPDKFEPNPMFPLIVFIQGSAWMKQNCYTNLPRLARFARLGYAVASIEYRESTAAVWPAQLKDIKAAIRYLKANADIYGIDKNRVAIMGNSSGGHLSLMVSTTIGMTEFDDELYPEEDSNVNCCVDIYGPADLEHINDAPRSIEFLNTPSERSPEGLLIGGKNLAEYPELAKAIGPVNYVSKDREYPPFLILHGDEDGMVPFDQSARMYQKLKECGKHVELYKVLGAGHGVFFYSEEVFQKILQFLKAYL